MKKIALAFIGLLLAGAAFAQTPQQTVGGYYNATPPTLSSGQQSGLQLDANGSTKTAEVFTSRIFVTNSATGTTTATTATLPGVSGKTTYLCGFSIRANATAAATGNATVTGTISGTLNFTQYTAALASGLGVTEPPLGHQCIPASATNTAVAVVSAAPGTGGVVSVSAWGFQQ